MNARKLVVLGILSLIGVTAFDTDAQAGLLRRRGNRGNDCNTCAAPVATSCNTCGGGYAAGMPAGGVPYAMPMPGGSSVVPAGGATIQPDGTVIPAGGTVTSGGYIIPASGTTYYDPATRSYYTYPGTGYSNNQGFVPGVIQGATGSTSYYGSPYYTTPATSAGQRLGRGLFRR